MTLAPGTFAGLAGPEIELFQRVLKDYGGIGVEIGCLDGFSSTVILEASNLNLLSIDPFIPDSMEASLIGSLDRYLANVKPFEHRGSIIKDYSHEVRSGFYGPIDFLFIDGDHRYEAVLQDFNDWTPLLKHGGLLAVHDSRMGRPGGANFHPGPSRMAAECIYAKPEQWEIVGEAFSLTIARNLA